MINYKEISGSSLLNKGLTVLAIPNTKPKQIASKPFCSKIEIDPQELRPFLQKLDLSNIHSSEFLPAIEDLYQFTKFHIFSHPEQFEHFQTLFSFLFTLIFSNECCQKDFFQSRSLNILNNFLNPPESLSASYFADILYDMKIIEHIKKILLSKRSNDIIIKNSLKLLSTFSQINSAIAQDILSTISLKTIIYVLTKYQAYEGIRNTILKLLHLLTKCDTDPIIDDFFEIIQFYIKNYSEHNLIILYISQMIIKSNISALKYKSCLLFTTLLNSFLEYNSDSENDVNFWEPALNIIWNIHSKCDTFIDGLNYKALVLFITSNDENVMLAAIGAIENILTHSGLTEFFIENYNVIPSLVIAYSIGTYQIKCYSISAMTNAIISAPESLIPEFINNECIGHLINSLEISKSRVLIKVIRSLDILLSYAFDNESIRDFALNDFSQNYCPDLFEKIFESDKEEVHQMSQAFLSHYPQLFENNNE
ncbi:hypothetical protein TRFO_34065 [Tritrichomonas foetus]|uniref:Uncharacterized protein n=1 Tax=Tritrichomonas foetus TaxID=1144522 RepID=A0A1J4JK39_9EUKA|nr:hypothetical protein TRFO_34065 [Tritrichomonas foetus]|eukprot:OHS99514.1 hypothetical protein TRFO_34065 [Tritrichomonas foetus]